MSKKKKIKIPEEAGCFDCMEKMGGKLPKGWVGTISQMKCPYCGEEKGIPSVSDFMWDEHGAGYVWD